MLRESTSLRSITTAIERQVELDGTRVAISSSTGPITFDELNNWSHAVADAIRAETGEGNEPVVVLANHGAAVLTAILGVMRAGKFYVPLDPAFPAARSNFVLQDTEARVIVADRANLETALSLASGPTRVIDLESVPRERPRQFHDEPLSPDSVCCLLYTSGSTGRPKGVLQSHRNVMHEVENYVNLLRIDTSDRLLLVSTAGFADSVRTIFTAFFSGATICPLDVKAEGIDALARWMLEQRVTIYRSVPTLWRNFASELPRDVQFPSVRAVYMAGEPVFASDLDFFRQHIPREDAVFVNGLGSVETFTYRWFVATRDTVLDDSHMPVGHDVTGKEALLLDEHDQRIAPGSEEVGVIAVRSRYVFPGYWKAPDLTATVLVRDPDGSDIPVFRTGDMGRLRPDGVLVHSGRRDWQVKVRGYRVEPGEIETALRRVPGIKNAVVVPRADDPGDVRLIAFIVPEGGEADGTAAGRGRQTLTATMPSYMVPSAFIERVSLPVLSTGKIDRRALVAEAAAARLERDSRVATPYVAPRTAVEQTLADIWAEVLDLDRVGVDDLFLQLGGDSISAMRIIARVTAATHVNVPVQVLFDAPTVAAMSLLVSHGRT